MSLTSLKRDIAKIKRKKEIDFEKIDYELAKKRHEARLKIMMAEELADIFDEIDEIEDCLASEEPSRYDFTRTGDDFRRDAEKARGFLGDDNPKMWKKDQATIEALHPILSSSYDMLKDISALGSSPKKMWDHYKSILKAQCKKEKEEKRRRIKEKETRLEEMEKKYGKPVRLHPDFSNNTSKRYSPEFADGLKIWGLGHLFPYEDFPEHDGKSIIELEDSD